MCAVDGAVDVAAGVADEVVDADVPIAGPASHQGILVREFCKHDFAFLLYGGLQGQLLL